MFGRKRAAHERYITALLQDVTAVDDIAGAVDQIVLEAETERNAPFQQRAGEALLALSVRAARCRDYPLALTALGSAAIYLDMTPRAEACKSCPAPRAVRLANLYAGHLRRAGQQGLIDAFMQTQLNHYRAKTPWSDLMATLRQQPACRAHRHAHGKRNGMAPPPAP